ncbi:MAG: histone family protein nucleoid-structuring protein [Hydrocarboniphaga sp.]|uniref:H-NS histone family protein n=1 Tax=Hydrocarboniphaga sp. TaxID=2033016 RepID=UPI002627880A|nr:H-NS histone family protein [Hydrocarboniphaga sp.]MDB5972484.1 histone family protein nucleoid-structuring protein [Hydrocarboniphaga sp.]
MTTYNDLLKQIESLTKQAEEIRKAELDSVIADIKDKMQKHGISLADLRGTEKSAARVSKKGASSGSKVAAKFRSPAGETWSGRGRTPKWLAEAEAAGAQRESFAI